jgi:hypothetical protein
MEIEEQKISQYNQAIKEVDRLDEYWGAVSRCRKQGNLIGYKWALLDVELELIEDVERLDKNINDESKFELRFKKLDKEILYYEIKRNSVNLFLSLVEKEKLLRLLENRAGKGGKLKDIDEDEMD